MNGRYFVDTNVFVYSFHPKPHGKAKLATRLIREALTTRKGVVSFQVVQEFLNVALRKFDPPFAIGDAEQYLATVFRPLLAVHSSPALYLSALRVMSKYQISWYDSVIVAGANEASCEVLYSEDLQDGQKFDQVRVVNPFA
jgi:predicted nucleic acid-binding protein